MEKKLPDSYVPDRRSKEYPTEIGSQSFKMDDLDLFRSVQSTKLKNFYNDRYERLKNEYADLVEDMNLNDRIYRSRYSFEPVIGGVYHLYLGRDGVEFLSIIAPDEWKGKDFIGSFSFDSNGRWIKII